jgi:hypothetical protein
MDASMASIDRNVFRSSLNMMFGGGATTMPTTAGRAPRPAPIARSEAAAPTRSRRAAKRTWRAPRSRPEGACRAGCGRRWHRTPAGPNGRSLTRHRWAGDTSMIPCGVARRVEPPRSGSVLQFG